MATKKVRSKSAGRNVEQVIARLVRKAVRDGEVGVSPDWSVTPVLRAGMAPNDELDRVLATHGGRNAAYLAEGHELIPVAPALRWRAEQLAAVLGHVSGVDVAPAAMVAQAEAAVTAWLAGDRGMGVEAWMVTLEAIVHDRLYRSPREPSPAAAILADLGRSAPDAPARLVQASAEAQAAMDRDLERLRLTRGRPTRQALSAWGLARKLAKAAGVSLPERRDAIRKPKTPRRQST